MSGPDIDLLKESGLTLFDEEIEGVFDNINARDLLLECECVNEDEEYGEDWAPGMSDAYYQYYAPSKSHFQRELRAVLLAHLSV
jgi:hypothetical protein